MLQWVGAFSVLGAALIFWGRRPDLQLGGLMLLVVSVVAGSGLITDERSHVSVEAAILAWFSGAVVGGGATTVYLGFTAVPKSWTAVTLGVITILIGYILPVAIFFLGGVR